MLLNQLLDLYCVRRAQIHVAGVHAKGADHEWCQFANAIDPFANQVNFTAS